MIQQGNEKSGECDERIWRMYMSIVDVKARRVDVGGDHPTNRHLMLPLSHTIYEGTDG
jgi:hypothetical protein